MSMIAYLRAAISHADDTAGVDWTRALILFFRVMSVFQLAKGMVHWALLMGAPDAAPGGGQEIEYLAVNIYFAVLDPVAGVGLWMTSSWGAVLWLLAAISQVAVCLGFAEVYGFLWPLLLLEAIVVGLYVYITWRVAQVSDD
jgi:hypothetical protein